MIVWIFFVSTVACEMALLRRLRFDWWTVTMVFSSLCLCFDYLAYTSITERNYDGSSHLEYIEYIARHFRLPNPTDCGVCGHPPLYYTVAAVCYRLLVPTLPVAVALAWLSLLLFFGFIVFSLLILRENTNRPLVFYLAAGLILFWPSSIINSVRVHNDSLVSFLMVGGIYFLARWDRGAGERNFIAALSFTALALFTKASGYAVAFTVLVFAACRAFSTDHRRAHIRRLAGAVLVLSTSGVLAVGLRTTKSDRNLCQTVLGNACDGRYVPAIPNTLTRFLSFHPVDFVTRLGTVPEDPFLNRFLTSTLFGVIPLGDEFQDEFYRKLGAIMSVVLLVLVGGSLLSLLRLPSELWRRYRVVLFSAVSLFVFLLAFRFRLPNEFHEDFRHIFPALVPFCLLYATGVERAGRSSSSLALRKIGSLVAVLMMGASTAFFIRWL